MKIFAPLVAGSLLIFPLSASAHIGKDFLEHCSSTNATAQAFCTGYIRGLSEVIMAVPDRQKASTRLCIAKDTSNDKMREAVIMFLKDHPNALNAPAAPSLLAAMAEAFPCSK